jgi:hypothetical protein
MIMKLHTRTRGTTSRAILTADRGVKVRTCHPAQAVLGKTLKGARTARSISVEAFRLSRAHKKSPDCSGLFLLDETGRYQEVHTNLALRLSPYQVT